jgi:hypothetical protein
MNVDKMWNDYLHDCERAGEEPDLTYDDFIGECMDRGLEDADE